MAETAEQAAYSWMQGAWSDFKFIASRLQQYRNRLNAAAGRGAAGAGTVLQAVDELERDYRVLRGTSSTTAPLVERSAVKTKAAWQSVFAEMAQLERDVSDVESDVPGGLLDKLGTFGKWAMFGAALYVANKFAGRH